MFLQYILLLIHCDNSNNDGDDTRDWQGDEDAPPSLQPNRKRSKRCCTSLKP